MSLFGPNIKKMLNEKDIEGLKKVVLEEKNQATKVKAINALAELSETKTLIALMAEPVTMATIVPHLVKMGSKAVNPLIKALSIQDKYIAGGAATALGLMMSYEAQEHIITKAKDPACPARVAMIVALGSYSGEEIKTALQELARDKNPEVGQAAMMSLGKVLNRR